jgi:hypothetical protein
MAGYHALRDWAEKAKQQMEADYAMKKLMEAENGRLRRQLFGQKQNGPRREGGSGSRHMTCNDMLDALAKADWTANIKVVHTEAAKKFRGIRQVIRDHEKAEEDLRRREERDQRAAAKEAAKAVKTAMTLAAKRIADAQKAAKRELVLARKAEEAAAKKAAVEAKRSAAAAKRADAEEKKRVAHERKMAARVEKERKQLEKASKTIHQQPMESENEDSPNHGSENLNLVDDNTLEPLQPSNIRPRPRPRPILHRVNNPLPDLHLHVVQVQSPTNVQKSVLDGEDDAHAAAAANADSVIVDKGQPVRRSTRQRAKP